MPCQMDASLGYVAPPEAVGRFRIGEHLSSGAFSEVYEAFSDSDPGPLCCKVIPRSSLQDTLDHQHFENEVYAIKSLNHPSIVHLHSYVNDEHNYYLFMERCIGTSLLEHINQSEGLNEEAASRIFRQLLQALAYLHSRGIAHRDIKPENIVINATGEIKLIDFGLCSLNDKGTLLTTFCGSLEYAAPECLQREPYKGSCADMWSAGVLLYAMCCGELPWNRSNTLVMIEEICAASIRYPITLSNSLCALIKELLDLTPDARITAENALVHPWLCRRITNITAASSLMYRRICLTELPKKYAIEERALKPRKVQTPLRNPKSLSRRRRSTTASMRICTLPKLEFNFI